MALGYHSARQLITLMACKFKSDNGLGSEMSFSAVNYKIDTDQLSDFKFHHYNTPLWNIHNQYSSADGSMDDISGLTAHDFWHVITGCPATKIGEFYVNERTDSILELMTIIDEIRTLCYSKGYSNGKHLYNMEHSILYITKYANLFKESVRQIVKDSIILDII